MPGPQFETPAEVRLLRTLGADVVGMSMALETVAARGAGVDVLGLAVVTNPASADPSPMSEVAAISAAGAASSPAVAAIVRHVIGSLP
jgi:purine-nucleoside phosphorylase